MKWAWVVLGIMVCSSAGTATYAETPKSSTKSYSVEQYAFNEGTTWMFGTTRDLRRSNIGESIIGVVMTSPGRKPVYNLLQGFMYVSLYEPPIPDYQYDINEIMAYEFEGGESVLEKIWQQDTDPFFEWNLKAGVVDVLGYSLSFDEYPDDLIDTTDSFFQTPEYLLTDGEHTFYVMAKSSGGSFGRVGTYTVWVDSTRPTASNFIPENGVTVKSAQPLIQAMVQDATSGLDLATLAYTITTTVDEFTVFADYDPDTKQATCPLTMDLPDGLVTVRFEATDVAGNEAIPLFWSFVIDTAQPEGWILINNDDPTTDSVQVTLTLFAAEIVTEVTEMIISSDGVFDTEEWESYSTEKEWEIPLLAGTRTLYAKFRDSAGNESAVFSDSIVLVMTIPNTFISMAPPYITDETTATFSYTATVPGCQFQYRFDDADWTAFSLDTSITFPDLAEGNHYFQVRAGIDLNGNGTIDENEYDESPAVVSWTVGTITLTPLESKQPIRYYNRE